MPTKTERVAEAGELGIELSGSETKTEIETLIAAALVPEEPVQDEAGVASVYSDSGRTELSVRFEPDGSGRIDIARDGSSMHTFSIMQEGPTF